MAEKGGYVIENEYQSGYSTFEPGSESPYLGKGALVKAGEMGIHTDPRSANQLAQLSTTLNQGVIPVEIGAISPQIFDTIPKQHFEEMKRKAKLTGAQLSLHAPIIDPAGMGERGWDESQRELAERQLKDVVDKAYLMKENDRDLPITMHAANSSGSTYKMTPEGKKIDMMVAINRETGQLTPLKEEEEYFPGGKVKKEIISPERSLKIINRTEWDGSLRKIEFSREGAERIMEDIHPIFKELYVQAQTGQLKRELSPEEVEQIKRMNSANEYVHEAALSANTAFKKAYKFAIEDNDTKAINHLNKLSEQYGKALGIKGEQVELRYYDPKNQSNAVFELSKGLTALQPKLFQQIEDFSTKHAAKTFSNVALHAYDKYGNNAPTVSIENLYQGMGFSQAEAMDKLLIQTKQRFVDERVKIGDSKGTAERVADKVIGMTFDMGHANMSKQHGFTSKDIVKEAEMIAKHVKHIHVTDNFGYSDSHLPLGMGNVPVREVLETLEKKGVKATKINEVGGWFEHFKTSPFQYILEAGGSPVYSSGAGPYWSQTTGFQQGYSEGYGMMLPPTHFQMYGSGFSQLPKELGGQAGQRGGIGGKPME